MSFALDVQGDSLPDRANIRRRRSRTLVMLAAGLAVGEFLILLGDWLEGTPWWIHPLYPAFCLASTFRCFRTTARQRGSDKKAWACFSLGCLGISIGTALWGFYGLVYCELSPDNSIVDVGYFAFTLFFLAGIWYSQNRAPSFRVTLVQLGNLGIILAAVLMTYLLYFHELTQVDVSLRLLVAQSLYGVLLLAVLIFALVVASLQLSGKKRRAMFLIFFGFGSAAVIDFNFALGLAGEGYRATHPLNGLYLLTQAFLYWAAFEQEQPSSGDPEGKLAHQIEDRMAQLETLLPPLTVAGLVLIAFWFRDELTADLIPYMSGVSVLFIASLAVRNWFGHRVEALALEVAAAHSSVLRVANRELQDEIKTRARVEAEFRQSHKMSALGKLSGGVADDFGNVLSRVCEKLDQLRRSPAFEDTELQELHSRIMQAAQCGTSLTRRLQALSRRDAVTLQRISAEQVLLEMKEPMELTLGRGVQIKLTTDGELWPVLADPSQLANAIGSLISNASEALSDGGIIWIKARNLSLDAPYAFDHPEVQAGSYVEIEVRDQGPGISTANLGKVFEPFFATKSARAGAGLGLTMVYHFAEQSGGHVTIESIFGQGTAVRLRIPSYRTLRHTAENTGDATASHRHAESALASDQDPVPQDPAMHRQPPR